MLNMIYGKALIDAHLKAEATSWAGCELDASAIEYSKKIGDINPLLERYTMLYDIPFKTGNGEIKRRGYALRLFYGRVLITQYFEDGIRRAFTQDNKGAIEGRTKVIFDNTIEFMRSHRINFPFYYRMPITKPDDLALDIFGKLEEDYTHIIIKIFRETKKMTPNMEVTTFDPDRSDRDFLNACEISCEIFEEQLKKVKKASGD